MTFHGGTVTRKLLAALLVVLIASPAGASMVDCRKLSSTAYVLYFGMKDSTDHTTDKTGLTVTCKRSKNGSASASCSGAVTELDSTNFPGIYYLAGNATDRDTLGPILFRMTGTGADANPFVVNITTNDCFVAPDTSSVQTANVTQWSGSSVATPNVSGVPKVDITHFLGTASAGSAGYCGPDWGHVNAPTSTVALSGTTVGTVTTTTTATTCTTATNLTNAPTNGDFTATMKTSLNNSTPASVTGAVGSVTGAVGSVAGNVTGSVGSVATGGITAASIAADAIGASELASDAVAEIQSGLATSSAVAGLQSDTDDIQARIPAALGPNGNLKADVRDLRGTASAGVAGYCGLDWSAVNAPTTTQDLSATSINTSQICGTVTGSVTGNVFGSVGSVDVGGITAASIAANAIGASELAADAVAEIQAGLALPADVTAARDAVLTRLGTPAGASVSSDIAAVPNTGEIADGVWGATLSDYTDAGTTGKKLSDLSSGGTFPTADEIALRVWTGFQPRALTTIAGVVTILGPTPTNGVLPLTRADDYYYADGPIPTFVRTGLDQHSRGHRGAPDRASQAFEWHRDRPHPVLGYGQGGLSCDWHRVTDGGVRAHLHEHG
jgi:hypothetical protein